VRVAVPTAMGVASRSRSRSRSRAALLLPSPSDGSHMVGWIVGGPA
jgi:hypothetical protein